MTKKSRMRDKNPLVSIVILNWNGLEDTLSCLESVARSSYENIEVIVVDNGSDDPITKKVIKLKIKLKIVYNSVNKGFAGGEVSALPHCNGEYIFLLNNDATVEKDAISEALATFEVDEKIAVVGGRSYSLHSDLLESLTYYSFQFINPVTADTRTYTHDDGIQDTVTISGAAFMVRRTAIDKYGYFDERFFAYYEETDLFARFLRAGQRIVYNPKLIIWHKDGASTKNKRYMYYYLMLKNQFLFAYKNYDPIALKQFLTVYKRNFRRSLWLYVKNASKTEAIHKARVRSTIWNIVNIFGTIVSRKKTLSINPNFSYTNTLLTQQPIDGSLIINARGEINETNLRLTIKDILAASSYPAEIIVITSKKIDMPKTAHNVTIRNIVDKNQFKLTAFDFGFMASNTDVLFFTDYNKLTKSKDALPETLIKASCLIAQTEAAIAVKSFRGSDLAIANGSKSAVIAIRKSDLVNFLDIHDNVHSINEESLGQFINWVVMDCRPIVRMSASPALQFAITSPQSTHATLTKPTRWRLKSLTRLLHISRILAVLKKRIAKSNNGSKTLMNDIKRQPISYTKNIVRNTPIIINTRDRVEPLTKLIKWLEDGKYTNIIFIDNDSTNPGLIDMFDNTPYQVIQLGRNGMHKSPWESFAVRFMAKDKPYVVTDPDIIPTASTPTNTIEYLYKVMFKYPSYIKAGVALKIDDLPEHYSMKDSVIDWESRFWDEKLLLEKDIYRADLDTTFALYRADSWWSLSPSLRVAGVYAMRHEPWYQNIDRPSDDMMYYRIRASNEVSTWIKGKLPKHHIRALKKEGLV